MNNTLKPVRAVLWDMDGVIADTGELHFLAWKAILTQINIPFDQERFRLTFGMNNTGILTSLLGYRPEPAYVDQLSDQKETVFREAMQGQIQLLPGVQYWLDHLQTAGYRQAIASSAPQANIEAVVDELKIRHYFTALVSAYNIPGKPDPTVFLEAARRLGVEPGGCVIIEDSIAGVKAAQLAKMKCIAVTNTHPRQELVGAEIICNNLLELHPNAFER